MQASRLTIRATLAAAALLVSSVAFASVITSQTQSLGIACKMKESNPTLAKQFNRTARYIDDLLTINNNGMMKQ